MIYSELKAEIERLGGKTSYLISNSESAFGKSKKAAELGISVIAEA